MGEVGADGQVGSMAGATAGVSDEIAQAKWALRRRMRELRESLTIEERERIDAGIAANVIGSGWYRRADALFTYLSVGAEVDTRAIVRDAWACGKLVAVPRVVSGTQLMEWHVIEGFDHLERSSFGIDEPPADAATLVNSGRLGASALALVPAYAFDVEGYRLGYGGGFYDEFLPAFSGVSMGLCRHAQLSPTPLPRRDGDIAVDIVITELGEDEGVLH